MPENSGHEENSDSDLLVQTHHFLKEETKVSQAATY